MRKTIALISLTLLLTFSNVVYSQNNDVFGIESLSKNIFELVSEINKTINTFFEKEKSSYLKRNLDYFQNDLRRYLKVRKKISDNLENNNYHQDNALLYRDANKLEKIISKLSSRLDGISSNVSSELSMEAESISENIQRALNSQQGVYIAGLYEISQGEEIDTKELIEKGKQIFKNLENSIELISKIREEIKKKES